jgi:hypothetical protein
MNNYLLKQIGNDVDIIARCQCGSIEEAYEYFSNLKKLSISDLLKIYVVVY